MNTGGASSEQYCSFILLLATNPSEVFIMRFPSDSVNWPTSWSNEELKETGTMLLKMIRSFSTSFPCLSSLGMYE